MKKIIALVLALGILLAFASCENKNDVSTATDAATSSASSDGNDEVTTKAPDAQPSSNKSITDMKKKYDSMEYTLYYNIFYNETGADYEGETITKEGTFTTIYDAFNSVTRYYVWGYADQTQCCDYQWEFVMPDGVDVPANGSYVTIKGTFTASESALDGYWFTDVELTVEEEYKASEYDFDTTTMSGTLERVQVINMEYYPDVFDGKTALLYGRALNTSSIQHPYYDESWSMDFINAEKSPATGTYLLLGGTIKASGDTCVLDVSSYTETD